MTRLRPSSGVVLVVAVAMLVLLALAVGVATLQAAENAAVDIREFDR